MDNKESSPLHKQPKKRFYDPEELVEIFKDPRKPDVAKLNSLLNRLQDTIKNSPALRRLQEAQEQMRYYRTRSPFTPKEVNLSGLVPLPYRLATPNPVSQKEEKPVEKPKIEIDLERHPDPVVAREALTPEPPDEMPVDFSFLSHKPQKPIPQPRITVSIPAKPLPEKIYDYVGYKDPEPEIKKPEMVVQESIVPPSPLPVDPSRSLMPDHPEKEVSLPLLPSDKYKEKKDGDEQLQKRQEKIADIFNQGKGKMA